MKKVDWRRKWREFRLEKKGGRSRLWADPPRFGVGQGGACLFYIVRGGGQAERGRVKREKNSEEIRSE